MTENERVYKKSDEIIETLKNKIQKLISKVEDDYKVMVFTRCNARTDFKTVPWMAIDVKTSKI